MNFNELILKRESCRNYSSKKVTAEQLTAIADAARLAPSAGNTQPWKFYAAVSEDVVAQITKGCTPEAKNGFLNGAPAYIVMTKGAETEPWTPKTPYNHHYRDFDCGAAASHICLAASDMGLSTCMIGWFDDKPVQAACKYPDSEKAVIVIAVGYAADSGARDKNRRALSEVMVTL